MVFGELGKYPLDVNMKCRMLCYWFKLIDPANTNKFSSIVYKFTYKLYTQKNVASDYLGFIEKTLNELGLSGFWILQENVQHTTLSLFKEKVKRCLYDQHIHKWFSEINTKDIFWNYKMYKDMFVCEDYINKLSYQQCVSLMRFRTINNNLPVQRDRYLNIPRSERICTKCTSGDVGDEFHYVLCCELFNDDRRRLLPSYFCRRPNCLKFKQLFGNSKKTVLSNLVKLLNIICKSLAE